MTGGVAELLEAFYNVCYFCVQQKHSHWVHGTRMTIILPCGLQDPRHIVTVVSKSLHHVASLCLFAALTVYTGMQTLASTFFAII